MRGVAEAQAKPDVYFGRDYPKHWSFRTLSHTGKNFRCGGWATAPLFNQAAYCLMVFAQAPLCGRGPFVVTVVGES